MSRSSPSSGAEPPVGSRLLAIASGAVAGVVGANLAPPSAGWAAVLVPLSCACGWRGLAHRPRGGAWWLVAGLLAGLAAGAMAPRAPHGAGDAVPARITGSIRDGWRSTEFGRDTRLLVESAESERARLRLPGELRVSLPGAPPVDRLPRPGSRVEIAGDLVFDPAWPLARPTLRVKNPRLITPLAGGSALDTFRQAAVERLQRAAGVSPGRIRAAGLAAALVLGRRELLATGDVTRLRQAGLAHLLAVSGLHVGMVAGLAWLALQLLGVPPKQRRWAVALVLVAFAGAAGGAAPVRRAALAGVLYLVARQLGRPLVPFPTVAAVIAVLLLLEPAAALEVSFQLSAVVTLVLVRWAGPLAGALKWPLGRTAPAVAVALVAQAASQPLVGHHFGSVPWFGVLANLVAVPVGFAAVGASLVATVAAGVSTVAAGTVLAALDAVRRVLAAIGGAAAAGAAAYPVAPALLAAVTVLGIASLPRWRRAAWAGLAAAGLAVAGPWVVREPQVARGELQALPVSVGTALLVRWDDAAVLIDGGERPGEAARALRRAGVRRLDAVFVTHPDSDHAGGVAAVLDELPVGRLLFPVAVAGRAEMVALRRRARALAVPEQGLVRGQRLGFGQIAVDVLWPPAEGELGDNDLSLVVGLRVGPLRLLVPGDIEAEGEYALLDRGVAGLGADLLVLGHHGSATSTTPAFLVRVAPSVALAATGIRPRYPYPAERVARRVRAAHVVLVTQRQGIDRIWWEGTEHVTVGTREPVVVRLRRGGGG